MLIVKRLVILLLMIIAISAVFSSSGHAEFGITSQPIAGKDGSVITAEEREMIRGIVPFFTAITNKDVKKMKEIHPGMRNTSDEQIYANFASVKSYIFHGLEDVSYSGGKLKARTIYSAEIIKPGTIGRNIASFKSDVDLIREGNAWVISGWTQIKGDGNDMEYFRDIFARIEKAEKRYGVKDLAKWDGL